MKLNVIKIENKYSDFYIAKISGMKLLSLSNTDIRELKEGHDSIGIQRKLVRKKVIQVGRYLDSDLAIFPNSVILNLDSKYLLDMSDNNLIFDDGSKVFKIIDGQHRVEAFRETKVDFDILVSIFIDLPQHKMSDIFKTINSTQKPLEPSLREELEFDSPYFTPNKMIVNVAKKLSFTQDSSLYQRISFYNHSYGITNKKATLSLASFVNEMLSVMYTSETHYHSLKSALMSNPQYDHEVLVTEYEKKMRINESKYVLWKYYKRKSEDSMYKILDNYFWAIRKLLPIDYNDSGSILLKTTGYRALVKLFIDTYNHGYAKKKLTFDFFIDYLSPISDLDGSINSKKYPGSSYALSELLYQDFKNKL